ncbi:hypothetical protein AAG570_003287 [Ranatra chinensis]|uniref:Rho-GAP domain-containing protein n=1 Tax=Ranatra chinensis TaxID=642074 RepID=A0ABD0YT41_9HEMI
MEFESPDVERDFPGLYASESGRRSNESDFSDESHERVSKKDLLIGKRKEKKDSKKDRGYATLEGESSPEEDTDIKSPSKSKKSKPFKFPSKKEKQREKSREKDVKERDHEKEKERKKSEDKDKDKKKEGKVLKLKKERKKSKHSDESIEIGNRFTDDLPVFGVPLALAVERSKCHDGVDIPLVVRDCIDHVQQTGLTAENVYKISGIKSRVQHVRRLYNLREMVRMSDYDLSVATTLLKIFLRELPEPVLTTELLTRFEEAGALRDVATRGAHFKSLVEKLPPCNRTLLAWLLKHFDTVTQHEKQNKMNAQSIATAFSPLMQTSERLLTALLCHTSAIFPNVELTKYVPPLTSASPALPDSCEAISQELRKQESLLGQIHSEMNQGRVSKSREEQLWEVQRIITQLKRKLRALERGGQRSLDEGDTSLRMEDDLDVSLLRGLTAATVATSSVASTSGSASMSTASTCGSASLSVAPPAAATVSVPAPHPPPPAAESLEVEDINRATLQIAETRQKAILETEELLAVIAKLKELCRRERAEVEVLRTRVDQMGGVPLDRWAEIPRRFLAEIKRRIFGGENKGHIKENKTKRTHEINKIITFIIKIVAYYNA